MINPRLSTDTTGPIGMVFFEPQTGIYKRDDWGSNFYHFRLQNGHRPTSQFTMNWLEDNVKQAQTSDQGLIYPDGFLEELAAAEQSAEQTIKQFLKLCPERANDVPKRM